MITLNKEIIENNYFNYLGEWIVKNAGLNYDINKDMHLGLESATQSSMRIRKKTLDTRPKYLGHTVRKKLKFCFWSLRPGLNLAINKASRIFLLAWIFGAVHKIFLVKVCPGKGMSR